MAPTRPLDSERLKSQPSPRERPWRGKKTNTTPKKREKWTERKGTRDRKTERKTDRQTDRQTSTVGWVKVRRWARGARKVGN